LTKIKKSLITLNGIQLRLNALLKYIIQDKTLNHKENMDKEFRRKIGLRIELLEKFDPGSVLMPAIDLMKRAIENGKKILVFGNGGSATQASHFAAELVNRFYIDRPAIPALALTTDISNLTSIANDSDYTYVFSRQVEAMGNEGDVVMGISTSGTSANVLAGLGAALAGNMKTVALCGKETGTLEKLGLDYIIPVQCDDTPVIQEMHLFFLHTMAEVIEAHMVRKDK